MWSSGRRVLQELVSLSSVKCFSQTAVKNTVMVERWWQVPLSKEGRPPRLHPRRHRIYKLVEDTKHSPKDKMEVILTQTVANIGGRGDTVLVKKSVGRNKLLAQGLAVYPSPENKQMFAEELRLLHEGKPEDRIQTRTGLLTLEFLKRSTLKIGRIPSVEYVLTKEIVCRQFLKKLGVVVPPHALRLPDEPIGSIGDYWCEVTVNGIDTVSVPLSLTPYEDPSATFQRMVKNQRREQANAESTANATVSEADGAAAEEDAVLEAFSEAATPPDGASAASPAPEVSATPQTAQDKPVPASDTPEKD
ncbi:large ribosomal subunit protein bL9m [Diretmus argenteus]